MKEKEKKVKFDISLFQRVLNFVRPYRTQYYSSILLAILLAFFTPVRPYLIQLTVDKATGKIVHLPSWLEIFIPDNIGGDVVKLIIAITVFQFIFLLIESFTRFAFSFITSWLGQSVVKDLRVAVYNKIMHLQLRQFDKTPIGTFTTRTINDIESINDIFSDGFIPIIADLLSIFITLGTMFFINWKLSIICLIPMPLLLLATYYFKESTNKSFVLVRNAVAALNVFAQEHLTGIALVQAFAAEKREKEKFEKINKQHRDANIKAIFAYSIFFPIVEIILALSTSLLVWWIADQRLDAGLMISFILYINQIFRPLRMIADKFNVLQMGMVASERVFKVLDNPDETDHNENGIVTDRLRGDVRFQQVWFAYKDDYFVLKDINLAIPAGTSLALVGHTGSGKTSIISLINKLYPIQQGQILVDGINIKDYNLDNLRSHIGVVLQDVFLFSGTVFENITLRNPAISLEYVIATAKLLDVHDFILSLPNGYDYPVQERGNSLSLGQRQLISFIRALLYNPSILILDEATSSIDSESELLVQRAMEKLIKGRTSIIIAHRLATIKKSDQIVVLDKGVVIEKGTHEELLDRQGFYNELHMKQFENAEK